MAKSCSVQRAVRYALATAFAAASVSTLHAQDAAAPEENAAAPIQEVIVTGSRIESPNEVSLSPITTVTAAALQSTGLSRAEDVLNNLPMVFAGQNSTSSNGGDGTATVDLRGLGPARTLVLVNGRRLGPGPNNGTVGGGNLADINQIPAALIERVDILTGGASSVYGADAVAGVVNFVLNTHFEGVKIDSSYNFYQHHQHSSDAALVAAAGDPLPDSSVNTGFGKDVSIVMGSNFADNKGNATLYATYDTLAPVLQSKYDHSACTINPTSSGKLVCGGSIISRGGYFSAYGATGTSLFVNTVDQKTGQFRPFGQTDEYNYGPLNYYQVPADRWTGGGFANYEINDHVQAYTELMFTRTTSQTQVAPSGYFGETGSHFIPCANPLLNASEAASICDPVNQAAQGNPSELINGTTYTGLNVYTYRRNVEGGGRQQVFGNNAFRTLVGLKGDFADAWTWDAYAQHSSVDGTSSQQNYLSNALIPNALNIIPNPATGGVAGVAAGAPVCASAVAGTDTKCVPWNIWSPGGVTPAALKYLTIPLLENRTTTEYVADANITGDLGKYGIKLPTAEGGLVANFGTEYRSEKTAFSPDYEEEIGAAAGAGGPTPAITGGFHLWELFTEARLPLLEHLPGAESVAFEGGYRYSSYSTGFNTSTFKLGLTWQPISDLTIRGGFNRSVRAPSVNELFSPQAIGLDFTADPCTGATPTASAAQCALTGVTAAQYGHIAGNPSNQYNGLLGGNPTLKPEKADTTSVGFVFKPSIVPNLVLSADYYNIKITGDINTVGGGVILQQCLTTGNPLFCGLVHRNANGSLWQSENGFVTDTTINVGSSTSKGVDVKANYRITLPAAGALAFGMEGTKVIGLYTQPITGGPNYNCEGFEGQTCGAGQPGWRHVLNTTWTTPWAAWDITLRWRYIGSVASDTTSPNPILNKGLVPPPLSKIPAFNYLDLSTSYAINTTIKLQLGVNNITDKDPPLITGADCAAVSGTPGVACNGNTWPGTYDALGRYVFAHVTAQF